MTEGTMNKYPSTVTGKTVEQKAEEYANNLLKDVTCNIGHPRARQINSIDIEDAWLYGYKEGFKDCAKARLNVTTISDCPIKDEERNSQEAYKELCENYSSNKSLYTDGFSDGYKECQKEHENKYKTAYIKGIRTMANALKNYDRINGAWTDYFEHTVEEVLKRLLKEIE